MSNMLRELATGILRKLTRKEDGKILREKILAEAVEKVTSGNPRVAIRLFEKYLEISPGNADVLNNLGICFAEVGRLEDAHRMFELAYQMDDCNMAVVVNYARHFVDNGDVARAMSFLIRARATIPHYPYINAVFGAAALRLGDARKARTFHLRAWLAQFDNLRLANSYMFSCAYSDINEHLLAAEHRFWGDTCQKPAVPSTVINWTRTRKKIRVGYWSPDLHSHSVRYFFRPLLEAHDPDDFEVYLYHDEHRHDEQTEKMQAKAGAFFQVAALKDDELSDLIKKHDLDVLVEMSGHTSSNRVALLQSRLARVQLSGIGYPPTTGLSGLDGKFLDPHLFTANASEYYSEPPVILPTSFWCFDPLEPIAEATEPPVVRNGFITFACVGNSAKINRPVLECWREILERVPGSRLLLRSVNFIDAASRLAQRDEALKAGLKEEAFEIVGPTGGHDLFASYHEIDIVLDTHPFNGGTTTCFAVYMGVPVVTRYGESLISRMGLSIMTNVGSAHLATCSAEDYVNSAVALAGDIEYLKKFKLSARNLMKAGSLGNGQKFARDLEDAYRLLLSQASASKLYKTDIDILPAAELIRRAYIALGYGQAQAAARIVQHCLEHYPDFPAAHILVTEKWTARKEFDTAIEYLNKRVVAYDQDGQISVYLNLLRFMTFTGAKSDAVAVLDKLKALKPFDSRDVLQMRLFSAMLTEKPTIRPVQQVVSKHRYKVLIPCDNFEHYEILVRKMIDAQVINEQINVVFERCSEMHRVDAYRDAISNCRFDTLIFLQKNIEIYNPNFFAEIGAGLKSADMLGFMGAHRWIRIDWAADEFDQKASGYLEGSQENVDFIDVKVSGSGLQKQVDGIVIMSGGLLAFNPNSVVGVDFDEELVGAGSLMEEAWSNAVQQAGGQLAVHRNLGIRIISDIQLDETYNAAARVYLVEKMGFDVFGGEVEDWFISSVPVRSTAEGGELLEKLWQH